MRRLLQIGSVLALAIACSDQAPDPNAQWLGFWNLISVDGMALPATVTIGGGPPVRFDSQTLLVVKDGSGVWSSTATGGYSGSALILWTSAGSTLTTLVNGSQTGRVLPVQEFVRQADGSLVRVEGSLRFVYHRN